MRKRSTPNQSSVSLLLRQAFSLAHLKRCLLLAVIPGLVCYVLALVLLTASGFSLIEAIRDSVQQTETSSWLGFVSNLGVFVTFSAAVICLFATSIESGTSAIKKQQQECLLLMGLLSALIAIDDFFLLHDRHIGQSFLYITYAFCLLMLLYRHRKVILRIDGLAFLIAGSFLGLSVLTDVVQSSIPGPDSYVQVFEEGCKFVGMVTWLYFSNRVARSALQPCDR